jgi:hypothetical protein
LKISNLIGLFTKPALFVAMHGENPFVQRQI